MSCWISGDVTGGNCPHRTNSIRSIHNQPGNHGLANKERMTSTSTFTIATSLIFKETPARGNGNKESTTGKCQRNFGFTLLLTLNLSVLPKTLVLPNFLVVILPVRGTSPIWTIARV